MHVQEQGDDNRLDFLCVRDWVGAVDHVDAWDEGFLPHLVPGAGTYAVRTTPSPLHLVP